MITITTVRKRQHRIDIASCNIYNGYGTSSSPGPIVTAGGLVFLAGTRDNKSFAFDKSNGKLLWEFTLPAIGSATPCTYMANGKQYVALSVRGDKESPSGYIIAFSLQ
ncbi:MAG: hypothetical protein WKG06_31850 [Segetibacter sp.]